MISGKMNNRKKLLILPILFLFACAEPNVRSQKNSFSSNVSSSIIVSSKNTISSSYSEEPSIQPSSSNYINVSTKSNLDNLSSIIPESSSNFNSSASSSNVHTITNNDSNSTNTGLSNGGQAPGGGFGDLYG